jgi:hypothetical protein
MLTRIQTFFTTQSNPRGKPASHDAPVGRNAIEAMR